MEIRTLRRFAPCLLLAALAACGGNSSTSSDAAATTSAVTGSSTASETVPDTAAEATSTTAGTSTSTSSDTGSAFAIRVSGSQFVDNTGKAVQLRGVNVSGLESVAVQGWDAADPWGGAKPSWSALAAWHVNTVRLPLNEASWLGYQCTDASGNSRDPDPGSNYQSTVIETVKEATAAGLYVILDLHWTAPATFCPLKQNPMADSTNSIPFWTSVANTFKSNPAVIFEMFNEPFLDVGGPWTSSSDTWSVWLNGGTATAFNAATSSGSEVKTSYTWTVAGMQQLVDAVRGTGATNVILTGGQGYSNNLSGYMTHQPNDPLSQLGVAWHVYSNNGYTDVSSTGTTTSTMLAAVAVSRPVAITEIGDVDGAGTSASFAQKILPWADAGGYSYLGWTWNVWNQSSNDLITDTSGTPTQGFGVYFKSHLTCRAAGSC